MEGNLPYADTILWAAGAEEALRGAGRLPLAQGAWGNLCSSRNRGTRRATEMGAHGSGVERPSGTGPVR